MAQCREQARVLVSIPWGMLSAKSASVWGTPGAIIAGDWIDRGGERGMFDIMAQWQALRLESKHHV